MSPKSAYPAAPLIVDQATLPVLQESIAEVKNRFAECRSLGLLLIDASNLARIEAAHGRRTYRQLLEKLGKIVDGMRGSVVRRDDIVTVNRSGGDQIYIFLAKKREAATFCSGDLEALGARVSREANSRLERDVFPYLKGKPNIVVGHSIVIHNPLVEEEGLVDRLIEDARTMARFQRFKAEIRNKEKLQEIIIKEDLAIHFQPIVELATSEVIGYEALSRGPKGSEYENPYFLFDAAREVGLVFELDRICRRKALVAAKALDSDVMVFVNCLPGTIRDPKFQGAYLRAFLSDLQRSPSNVVMEVSEREAIDDYPAFRAAMGHYSDLGFSIAVDDTGAGYSSLEAIVELEPDYLKLDISMVRGISRHPLKQEMIKAIIAFARSLEATIIAEGIETDDELEVLRGLGVPLGQGFLLGRPSAHGPVD